jgi:hypothetical protein
MYLINPQNEYPRHIGDLQAEHPDWQPGQELPDGWVEVLEGELPSPSMTQFIRELPIAQNQEGRWVRQFELADVPADEMPDEETIAEILATRARIEQESAQNS